MTNAVCGFVNIGGKRYYARKAICTRDGTVAMATGIYVWKGDV